MNVWPQNTKPWGISEDLQVFLGGVLSAQGPLAPGSQLHFIQPSSTLMKLQVCVNCDMHWEEGPTYLFIDISWLFMWIRMWLLDGGNEPKYLWDWPCSSNLLKLFQLFQLLGETGNPRFQNDVHLYAGCVFHFQFHQVLCSFLHLRGSRGFRVSWRAKDQSNTGVSIYVPFDGAESPERALMRLSAATLTYINHNSWVLILTVALACRTADWSCWHLVQAKHWVV